MITTEIDTTPHPPFIDKLPSAMPLFTDWCDSSCGAWMSGLKKDLLQREHTNPTPKWTLCMWAQMVALEVDGPSLQPSTWHWYMLLMPPNWMHRGYMLAGISPSNTEGTVEEVDSSACSAGTEASGSLDS